MDKKKLIFSGLAIAALVLGVTKRVHEVQKQQEVIDIRNESKEEQQAVE